ncbi:Putative SOS response-associated peptidase YedK [Filomicrobium insigne]|uniref:Abasic site processing protein n=1 Tax=Filomicrobium insigne TaxID=418854 RepID=A0A1H0SDZ3_9HYPH|nr:Putative SOS response-associated peptidase YedK [Filomicrobium insigne]
MCNCFSQSRSRDEVARWFRVSHNRAPDFDPQSSFWPKSKIPVVRHADDGAREIAIMMWGFVFPQKDKAPRFVTNVRDDKIRTSPFWRASFESRRCLVPATSYADPNGEKPAKWVWFALKGDEQRPLFAFPGIWRRWNGPIKKDGEPVEIETVSFMTTDPNALTREINHDRMPVLLTSEDEFATWLTGSVDDAFGLVHSHDPAHMRIVQAGKDKQDLLAA